MSVYVTSWVLRHSPATGNDRMVLFVIADEADNEGLNAHPGYRTIATLARIHRNTVIDAVARLEAGGELLVHRPAKQGRGHFNRYAVVMGRDPNRLAEGLGWAAPNLNPVTADDWRITAQGIEHGAWSPDEARADDEGHNYATLSEYPQHGENPAESVDNTTPKDLGITDPDGENSGDSVDNTGEKVAKGLPLGVTDPKTQSSKTNPRVIPNPEDDNDATPKAASGGSTTSDFVQCEFVDGNDQCVIFAGHDGRHVLPELQPEPPKSKAAPTEPSPPNVTPPPTPVDAFAYKTPANIAYLVFDVCHAANQAHCRRLADDLIAWCQANAIPEHVIIEAIHDAERHHPALPTWLIPNITKRCANINHALPLELPKSLQPKGTR